MVGGGQRLVSDLMNYAHTWSPSLILLGSLPCGLEDRAAAVVKYDGRYNRPWSLFGTAILLRHVLRSQPTPILHTHGWDADVIGAMATLGTETKQVCHLTVMAEWLSSTAVKHRIRRWITSFLLGRQSTGLVAVSEAVKRHWVTWMPETARAMSVVHNGIDTKEFSALPERPRSGGPIMVGIAARLVTVKGLKDLLDAFAQVCRMQEPVQLHIAGTGPLERALRDRARVLGIADRVFFHGYVDDLPAFYRSIDIYAHPSLSEGLPLGLLEAMVSGLPIVATNVGGTAEAVTHGAEGLLVPARNPQALADALRTLIRDSSLRAAFGRAAHARAIADFSMQRVIREIEATYDRIIQDTVVKESVACRRQESLGKNET